VGGGWRGWMGVRGGVGLTLGYYRPHTLPPEPLFLAHLAPYLATAERELEAELREVQAENEVLARGVEGQREVVEGLVRGLEAVVRDLEGANRAMGEVVEGGGMRMETGEMEEELRVGGRERTGVKM